MSDFDREAEREKLQEKYEEDTAEREATEKMSELLLQGATMTNAHCSECNDPIFRYDGQEFCATCERPVDRNQGGDTEGEAGAAAGDDGDDGDDDSAAADTDGDQIQVTSPEDDARVKFGGQPAENDMGEETPETTQQRDESQQPGETQHGQETEPPAGTRRETVRSADSQRPESPPAQRTPSRPEPEHPPQQAGGAAGGGRDRTGSGTDISTAQESLVRTLTRFSQQAEATDDPQRAREYLAASREAAETLAALRR